MAYTIAFSESAEKQLRKLPQHVQERVAQALPLIASDPFLGHARKLAGHEDLWRWRLGNYRIVYRVDQFRIHILVIRVGHRANVYRGL
ncbi:MAG: type II toxin-antitoxin system RelE/ParE family toxin [Acidobacteriia bacterium]|nr:type II toxin-antitoxin system RelE/ParE family toxin [Terriglobia bacterium]